ncbi:putative methyltransferase-domain-containing protein [Collybia nuda]|uniref:Methyltransferase-domain-containing protein n=1 Tax=Collybia nuda TaxID=64659 RepID=A0A9P5Y3C0_9AGAR|nr:putative methyltransferase-domain-containing protein [Collybia nuda]
MFFYISFLRPPPLQAPPFGTIQITPQIANDLRTEPFTGTQDLFYSWSQSPSGSSTHGSTETKPTKLTTWRQANAYKEIPVPVPHGIRDGQTWHLLLQAQGSSIIDLADGSVGRVPFPVLSMPILFGSRGGRGVGKQEQVERLYQLRPAGGPEAPILSLRITEQTSFDLDKKVWDSGVGLSSWLVELDRDDTRKASNLRDALFSSEPRNILELGAGTGIVSLALAALRSKNNLPSEDQAIVSSSRIIATDLESAMPLLEHNISLNSFRFAAAPEALVLDWDNEILPEYIRAFTSGFDAIIMADVTYNTASFPALVRTLSSVLNLSSSPPLVLLGYKERDEAERTLWDLAREVGLEFEKIGERKGAGGAPVEVWLGYISSP